MARFVARDGSLIVTSLKVASTTLDQAPQLRRLRNPDLLLRLAAGRFRRKLKVLFYRDPFSRTLSVFRSKFLGIERYRSAGLQNIHYQVMRAAGVSPPYTIELATDFAEQFTFDRFLQVLPVIYRRDLHTLPQAEQLYFHWRGIKFMEVGFDCIVDLSNCEDVVAFERRFDTPLGNFNRSFAKSQFALNAKQCEEVKRIYRSDYKLISLFPNASCVL